MKLVLTCGGCGAMLTAISEGRDDWSDGVAAVVTNWIEAHECNDGFTSVTTKIDAGDER